MPAGPQRPAGAGDDLGGGRVGRPVATTPPPSARPCASPCPTGRRSCCRGGARSPRRSRTTGAASSAKRIIRIAPMAKFGAMRQLLRVNVGARSGSRSSSVNPVVPTTAWIAVLGRDQARFSRAASRLGEVDHHLGPGVDAAPRRRRPRAGRLSTPADLAQVDAGVERVDRGDQLELGVGEHGPAHRGAHAPRRAEHPDPSSCGPEPTWPGTARREVHGERQTRSSASKGPTAASERGPSKTRRRTRCTSSGVTAGCRVDLLVDGGDATPVDHAAGRGGPCGRRCPRGRAAASPRGSRPPPPAPLGDAVGRQPCTESSMTRAASRSARLGAVPQ